MKHCVGICGLGVMAFLLSFLTPAVSSPQRVSLITLSQMMSFLYDDYAMMTYLTQNEIQSPYFGLRTGLPPNLSFKLDYFASERGLKSNYTRTTGVNHGYPKQFRM